MGLKTLLNLQDLMEMIVKELPIELDDWHKADQVFVTSANWTNQEAEQSSSWCASLDPEQVSSGKLSPLCSVYLWIKKQAHLNKSRLFLLQNRAWLYQSLLCSDHALDHCCPCNLIVVVADFWLFCSVEHQIKT